MKVNTLQAVDSVAIYDAFWMCWKLVGISTDFNKYARFGYDMLLNFLITIFYPLHLTIGLLMEPTQADVFKNLAINVTCFACSVKHYCFRYKLEKIKVMQRTLSELDNRAVDIDERKYFNTSPRAGAQRIINLFYFAYIGSNFAAIISVLLSSERRLMYPAWFPFNWQTSALTYWLALSYQIIGVTIQIVQNLANDIYPAMSLCIVSGHVRMLAMRLAKIGYQSNKQPTTENDKELILCIEDHNKLLNIFYELQDILSFAQLVQFISSGLNICIVLIYLLFYVDNIFASIYYAAYFVAMTIELFPCCYYGSMLELEFQRLTYAIFTSNWLVQSSGFRKNMTIFTELSLKKLTPLAGGILAINLNAFFATCKMAYSLFAVIMRVK